MYLYLRDEQARVRTRRADHRGTEGVHRSIIEDRLATRDELQEACYRAHDKLDRLLKIEQYYLHTAGWEPAVVKEAVQPIREEIEKLRPLASKLKALATAL